MIDNWKISNFKSIKDSTSLDLAPLTLFVGANSSGKSTIIQSILLVAQTIQNTVADRSVVLNGSINKFGEYTDIVFNADNERQIQIEFDLKKDLSEDTYTTRSFFQQKSIEFDHLSCAFRFSSLNAFDGISGNLYPSLEWVQIARFFQNQIVDQIELNLINSLAQKITDLKLDDERLDSDVRKALRYDVETPNLNRKSIAVDLSKFKIVGGTFNHFVPSGLTIHADFSKLEAESMISFITQAGGGDPALSKSDINKYDYSNALKDALVEVLENSLADVEATQEVTANVDPSSLRSFRSDLSKLNNDFSLENLKKLYRSPLMAQIGSSLRNSKQHFESIIEKIRKPDYQAFNMEADFGGNYIKNYFANNVKYLGPLRNEPRSIYPIISHAGLAEIGIKGENTAAILELNRHKVIEYIPPSCFEKLDRHELRKESKTLSYAVQDWLSYMNIASKVNSIDKGKFGHELKIATEKNMMHDLTHVGVGVSQILPILVQALMAPKFSTLIFEQPELHLHPRVQSRLADFFISVQYLRKQCIVETHSEYMVNRIRYLIAIGDGRIDNERSKIYFVKKESGSSKYEEIQIDEDGIISNWPNGFFDESEKIAAEIIKANLNKRKRKK